MVNDSDVSRAATLLIRRHGNSAPTHAAGRIRELFAAGDLPGWAIWGAILRAVRLLLAEERTNDTSLH